MERFVDEMAPAVEDGAGQRGGSRIFQYQSQCPFHAFAELRLRAEKLEVPGPGLSAGERGTLAHKALEQVWLDLRTHEALCAHPDLHAAIGAAAARALHLWAEEHGRSLPERFAALEQRRLERLLAEWLEIEKQRPPFEVLEPESEREVELSGIRARVRIDRIDRLLADGREVIIDYKTGRASPADWEGGRPNEPQLPLYAVTWERPLAGVLFARVKPGESKLTGVVDQDVGELGSAEPADLPAKLEEWRGVLSQLGEDFLAGRADADPNDPNKNCRNCPLTLLCRVGERRTIEAEDE
jgi:probable DNA repair protein